DPLQAQNFPLDEFGVGVFLRTRVKFFLLNEECGLDGRKGIANLMGDAGGKHAERGQFLVTLHQGLAFHQLDAQRSDHVPVNHGGERHAKYEQHPIRWTQFGRREIRTSSSLRSGNWLLATSTRQPANLTRTPQISARRTNPAFSPYRMSSIGI